ncbi:CHRD domain-containing protein [Acetobacter tropicalis]|nr:CHRD domain-containing protein [Acetobacter tropicalis]
MLFQHRALFCAAMLGGSLLAGHTSAFAERSERFSGIFYGEHGTTTRPTGRVDALFYPAAHVLRYSITWDKLSGPVTAAHFHGPARKGHDAPAVISIDGPYKSPVTGSVSVNQDQEDMLHNGTLYVNLHTHAHPSGEARAQLAQ